MDELPLKLYDDELSSDCYKVRLLLSLLHLPFERLEIDFHPGFEQEGPAFLALNPLGRRPVIDAAGYVLRNAQAILVYLACRFEAGRAWYPRDSAETLGQICLWLGTAAELSSSAGAARLHDSLFLDVDIDRCRREAHALLRVLDEQLWFAEQDGRAWLCSREHPTLADLACFPDIMLCEEGGISRLPYPAVRRWTDRFKELPGFIAMPGIFCALPAVPAAAP